MVWVWGCVPMSWGGGLESLEFRYDKSGKRDPFLPWHGQSSADSQGEVGLTLEGVVFDPGGKSLALLNGKVCRVGDEIAGYQVEQIDIKRVRLRKGAEVLEVILRTKDQEDVLHEPLASDESS